MGFGYYLIRDKLPFLVYFLYVLLKDREGYWDNLIFALINWSYLMAVIYFIYSSLTGLELWFSWTYASPISWGLTSLSITGLMMRRGYSLKFSTMLGSLAVSAGGYLYEIPNFLREGAPLIRVQPHNVFIISFQIISIFIFGFYLKAIKVRPSRRTGLLLIVYLIHGYFMYLGDELSALHLVIGNYHYRAPLIILTLSLVLDSQRLSE